MGARQLGLVEGYSAQEPREAIFWVRPGAYGLSMLFTDGEEQEKSVKVEESAVSWLLPGRTRKTK